MHCAAKIQQQLSRTQMQNYDISRQEIRKIMSIIFHTSHRKVLKYFLQQQQAIKMRTTNNAVSFSALIRLVG